MNDLTYDQLVLALGTVRNLKESMFRIVMAHHGEAIAGGTPKHESETLEDSEGRQ